ncbi:hypothetical protein A3C18_03955 [Candidatus Kaiserbacteria bacterium RIFCSPHIGHO2_02_FULL_54_11b]|uniref:Uncharacterized protein n=2 Tax=Candidatus Kaiseribacteriota TaxID=1752734 RepID=A0A1F6CNG8_9BACT|nr:MAG: hypothetical protein A2704_00010 [Candidatus Kaiserbacteria bacterium RIFCSPHIGHO2_01_FULL_54_36b]OGG63974.1 MAG: hypothetical protein A3C18_03955 [Candidatus Kaiserbacteria bacterium RIFCSPHIGHO2_02_FULL_54_11b]
MLLIKAVLFIRTTIPRILAWAASIGWWKVGGGLVLVAVALGAGFVMLGGGNSDIAPTTTVHSVEIKSVAELANQTSPLSVVGQVSSQSEATVRTEKSGQVVGVYRALGQNVSAGTVVAEISNASERAAVLQAEGVVDAAQANLAKVSGGVRTEQRAILETNVVNAEAALEAARASAVNALLSAYATGDNAIHGTTDKMFTNPGSIAPVFTITSSDSQLTMKIDNTRPQISVYLKRQADTSGTLSPSSDLLSEISTTEGEIRATRAFLDMMISALNKGIPTPSVSLSAIATYLAEAITTRTSLTTTLSALSASTQSITAAKSAVEVARKNLEQGIAGGQTEDVAAAKASLKQAQGALAAARANLEKSIIRAPISGTINSLSLKRGDYVQMSSPVLTVANNRALEIVAYITENDAREIAVGQKASIDDATGVVTHIAPALDPLTKKIEVRIGVENAKDLINGQSVLVSIVRTSVVVEDASRITIPIAAVKVESDRTTVFSVEGGVLVAHPVVLGALLGERVVVSSGLTPSMRIVTDARGLREGESVEVQ